MHGGRELIFEEGEALDKDRAMGTINEVAGRAKRQVAEWTGDTDAQIEGGAQEVKGRAQNAWGATKDAVWSARDEVNKEQGGRRDSTSQRDGS